jgi:hypothetical protein
MAIFYPQVTHQISGNTAGATASISSGTMTLAGGSNITLSQAGNAISIVGASQSVESQSVGMSNLGNTSGTTGIASGAQVRFVLAGGNNITLSQSLNGASGTITISAPNLGAGAGYTAGVSTGGNTSGNTGMASNQLVLAGGNNITLSGSTNGGSMTVTISAPNLGAGAGFSAGASNLGDTAGTTGTVQSRVVFVGSGGNTLSQSVNGDSATLTILGPAVTGSYYQNGPLGGGVNIFPIQASGSNVPHWNQWFQPYHMTWEDMYFAMSRSTSGSNAFTIDAAIYGFSNSTRMTLMNSVRNVFSHTATASVTGHRIFAITGLNNTAVSSLTPGFYVMGIKWSFGATASANYSLRGNLQGVATGEVRPGTDQYNTTNVSAVYLPFMGKYSTTTATFPGTVATSEVLHRYIGSSAPLDFWFLLRGTTN